MPDQPSADRVTLAGSKRTDPPQTTDKGPVEADQKAEVTIVLRSRTSGQEMHRILEDASAQPIAARQYLSREQLTALRGADSSDIEKIRKFAAAHHLTMTRTDEAARTVSLEGTLEDLQHAFGVELRKYEADGHTFHAPKEAIQLPREIAPAVKAVLGLDTRPAAHPR